MRSWKSPESIPNGNGEASDFDRVFSDICSRVRASGHLLGTAIGATVADARRVKGLGVQWVVFGQDSRILAEGLRDNLNALEGV